MSQQQMNNNNSNSNNIPVSERYWTLVDKADKKFSKIRDLPYYAQQETDFKEWKPVVQEIVRFLKADTAFMNIRPLWYSLVLDPHPDVLPHVAASVAKKILRLRDAVLSSYHHNEVKFSELTLDTFRMLQCLEWEPSGSFYQSTGGKSCQNGALGSSRVNHSQDIADPTLPPNPRKAVLYRPSLTHFIAVLATICEDLPADGVLLIYLSASGTTGHALSPSGSGTCINTTENIIRDFQSHTIHSDGTSTSSFSSPTDSPKPSASQNKGDCVSYQNGCFQFGNRGSGGLNCIYPSDLIPFTRRPLFIIIESNASQVFKAISGAEKGERAALLLSPSFSFPVGTGDSSRHSIGRLFTVFLTAPLQAFCLLLGVSGMLKWCRENSQDTYKHAESLLSSSLIDWGFTLETSDNLDPVWAQLLRDPFLRRFLLRFFLSGGIGIVCANIQQDGIPS
ncbi:hypothetical protein CRYUN_Cryun08bG0053600 [Craigia yunnanensis]